MILVGVIRTLINICSHPQLIIDSYTAKLKANEAISDDLTNLVKVIKDALHITGAGSSASDVRSITATSSSGGVNSNSIVSGNKPTRNFLQNSSHSAKMSNHTKDFSQYLDIALSGDV